MKKLAGLTIRGRGKAGDMVWGKDYQGNTTVRGYQPNVANPQSDGQKTQRAKMALLGGMSKNLLQYFKVIQRLNRGKISPTAEFNGASNQSTIDVDGSSFYATMTRAEALTVRVGNDVIPTWEVTNPAVLSATTEYTTIEVDAITVSDNRIINGDLYECWICLLGKTSCWVGAGYSTTTAGSNTCEFSGFEITADNHYPELTADVYLLGITMYNTRTGQSFSPPRNGKSVTLVNP
jgi:hypothetical protein